MVLLDPDTFLIELGKLYAKRRTKGSVVVTLKKYSGQTKPTPKPRKGKAAKKDGDKDTIQPDEHLCLIRAKSGNKKLSTNVGSKDVTKFQMNLAVVMKNNCTALKRKEKLKKEKKKAPKAPKKKD